MLSHQELYSLSPAIREMIKEDNMKHKVPNTMEQFQKEVALPFTRPETVEITVKAPEDNENSKTSTLLYSMLDNFVQTSSRPVALQKNHWQDRQSSQTHTKLASRKGRRSDP